MYVRTLLSTKLKGILVSISGNIKGTVELNQNTLCVYGFSKGCSSGMTEYINLELSGNDKGDDQLTEKAIFARYYYSLSGKFI